ncbi:MAG: adenylyl-sulfate kinase [Alphaproteobacteria bacterium]
MASALPAPASRPLLKVAIVGHVDHGKSTLVGRLLNDMNALPDGKVDAVAEMCRQRGMPFEWAFVTDALRAERDQGITIDASHIRFSDPDCDYVLIDAPGHREFLKNMISGAAGCDAALVVIDAEEGVREQSRRHGYLLHLLGVRQIAVAVTKLDRTGFDAARFAHIEGEFRRLMEELGVTPNAVIPVSGRDGDNIASHSERTPWYRGSTVMQALAAFAPELPALALPLRIPVQDVYRFDTRRIIAGRVESGRISVGDEIVFSPSNHVARVRSIEGWSVESPISHADAGEPVGITLDEQIFVERGEVISHVEDAPMETNVFRARLFWLGEEPLTVGERYTLRLGTTEAAVDVEQVERVVDTAELRAANTDSVPRDSVADVVLRTRALLALDPADSHPRTGRFVLARGYDLVGGGLIDMEGYPDQRQLVTRRATNVTAVDHAVTQEMRMARNGHRGGVMWFTGLSGSGKSTIAIELERRLFQKGYQVYVLDGDNVRHGLNANLGFTPEDRAENIRRVGEVAALMAQAGFIVLSAFISPYRSDRERARMAAGNEHFHEVYVSASLDVCEQRDPKGLYGRARAGEIKDFTGISAPYEPPEACEIEIDTGKLDLNDSLDKILRYVERQFPYTAQD